MILLENPSLAKTLGSFRLKLWLQYMKWRDASKLAKGHIEFLSSPL